MCSHIATRPTCTMESSSVFSTHPKDTWRRAHRSASRVLKTKLAYDSRTDDSVTQSPLTRSRSVLAATLSGSCPSKYTYFQETECFSLAVVLLCVEGRSSPRRQRCPRNVARCHARCFLFFLCVKIRSSSGTCGADCPGVSALGTLVCIRFNAFGNRAFACADVQKSHVASTRTRRGSSPKAGAMTSRRPYYKRTRRPASHREARPIHLGRPPSQRRPRRAPLAGPQRWRPRLEAALCEAAAAASRQQHGCRRLFLICSRRYVDGLGFIRRHSLA